MHRIDRSSSLTTRLHSRREFSRLLFCAALAALPLLGGALPASAQFGQLVWETDENVAVPELSRMIPSAGVRTRRVSTGLFSWKTVNTFSLFAVTDRGISTRHWTNETGTWSTWEHLGPGSGAPLERISGSGDDPGLDFGLPLLPGFSVAHPDWIAYQGFGRDAGSNQWPDYGTAIMNVDSPMKTLDYAESRPPNATLTGPGIASDFDHFDPQTGFVSIDPEGTNNYARHMFGTGLPRGYKDSASFVEARVPLIELRHRISGAPPTWHDHGTPGEHTGVAVGSGSSASLFQNYTAPGGRTEQKFVFVATDPFEAGGGDGLNGPEIAYLQGDGQNFAWHALGAPAGFVYGAPLAIPYYTGVPVFGGLGRMHVFAVAQNGSRDFELFTQVHDGNNWSSGWTRHGAPRELGGEKFKLTSSVVWYDGPSSDYSNLRINAFGYSEEANGMPGGLVERFWNGSYWYWSPVRTAPNGESLRTTHSVVSDTSDKDRISVIVRTTSGRIYEYYREMSNGRTVAEGWKDLSFEPLFRRIPPIIGFK